MNFKIIIISQLLLSNKGIKCPQNIYFLKTEKGLFCPTVTTHEYLYSLQNGGTYYCHNNAEKKV